MNPTPGYRSLRTLICLLASFFFALVPRSSAQSSAPSFIVTFPKTQSVAPLDGRLLLILSTDPSQEPRMQINDTPRSQIIFGINVDGLQPEQPAVVDDNASGYPVKKLSDLKPGDYYVQAVLHPYETFHRADGKTI